MTDQNLDYKWSFSYDSNKEDKLDLGDKLILSVDNSAITIKADALEKSTYYNIDVSVSNKAVGGEETSNFLVFLTSQGPSNGT